MVMKRIGILVFVVALLQVTQIASALPPGGPPSDTYPAVFDIKSGNANVYYGVYQCTGGEYLNEYVYTYQISNEDTGAGLSFFSVGIANGANVKGWGWDPGIINPSMWTPTVDYETSQVQSMGAFFSTPINNGKSSATLWFVSDYGHTTGQGFLFGNFAGASQYDTAELFAPVPEPATISLLATGGAFAAFSRKRKAA